VLALKASCEDCPLWASHGYHAARVGAYAPMLAIRSEWQIRALPVSVGRN
jgi:hypothetical protein